MRRAACIVALTLGACASLAQSSAPAVLLAPDAASRAELQRVVAAALERETVTLADDALMHASFLLIERTPRRDAAGLRLNGRELDRPERFDLSIRQGRCVLTHQRTAVRHELRHVRCASARG
jgi:hypothetical protein